VRHDSAGRILGAHFGLLTVVQTTLAVRPFADQ
jgi:hypothetical protein